MCAPSCLILLIAAALAGCGPSTPRAPARPSNDIWTGPELLDAIKAADPARATRITTAGGVFDVAPFPGVSVAQALPGHPDYIGIGFQLAKTPASSASLPNPSLLALVSFEEQRGIIFNDPVYDLPRETRDVEVSDWGSVRVSLRETDCSLPSLLAQTDELERLRASSPSDLAAISQFVNAHRVIATWSQDGYDLRLNCERRLSRDRDYVVLSCTTSLPHPSFGNMMVSSTDRVSGSCVDEIARVISAANHIPSLIEAWRAKAA